MFDNTYLKLHTGISYAVDFEISNVMETIFICCVMKVLFLEFYNHYLT